MHFDRIIQYLHFLPQVNWLLAIGSQKKATAANHQNTAAGKRTTHKNTLIPCKILKNWKEPSD
jgi:hypothetical protein